jgi:hypothetical protein
MKDLEGTRELLRLVRVVMPYVSGYFMYGVVGVPQGPTPSPPTQESHDREAENKLGRPHAGPYFGRDFCVTHRRTTKCLKSFLPCRAIHYYSPLAGSQWNAPQGSV